DELDERPRRHGHLLATGGGLLRRRERVLVAAQTVVEQGARPLAHDHPEALAPRERVGAGALDERARVDLTALPREQPERSGWRQPGSGRLDDRRGLLH